MPLVRVEVRNEYGLGLPDLYKEVNREDPKAVLDGVAVAGLVGILRQLGDLAEFAAEVFHGIQEQVMNTASRSHRLMVRVQHIEAVLPPLESAILAQRSHLHLAYTAGSQWHARIHSEQNHFVYNDLPRFIMDSYEECRDPPRLHLLDRFDTGGPGSCLKRYSDPTFFRRAAASSDEANAKKVRREKKVRRSKKKRARQRNGELARGSSMSNYSGRVQFASQNVDEQTSPSQTVSTFNESWRRNEEVPCGASVSNCSGRMQFDSPIVDELASPSQTGSTFDVTLKSDIGDRSNSFDLRTGSGDRSNSFDLRTGSGYIECVFHPSYSVKPEEQERSDLPSPQSKMKHRTLDSGSIDEQSGVTNDDSPQSSCQEQTRPSSSCVTWDEKTEIVEPTDQNYDHVETSETTPTNISVDTQEREVVNIRSIGQMEFEFYKENTPTSIPDENLMEENDSEPDNYEDALNTIESESETDLDCQTKREIHQYPSFINEVEDTTNGLKAHQADHHPSTSESHTPVYDCSNKGTLLSKPNLVSSESDANELLSPIATRSSSPGNELEIGYHEDADSLDCSHIGSVVSNISHTGSTDPTSQAPTSDKIVSSSSEAQKSASELTRLNSVTIWTNGGLLGLEPSKPPDFTLKNSECSTSCQDDNQDGISVQKTSCGFSTADFDAKFGKSGDSHHSNRYNHADEHVLNGTSPVTPVTKEPVSGDVKAGCTEVSHDDGEKQSRMFGLGNRLLANGLLTKASVVQNENSEPASSNGGVKNKTRERNGLPVSSPSSSPPLQHMKISFQPVNGFGTSKLSLKFPDRSHSRESFEDMFPSFQLVPEPSFPLHHNGSDSDDDTFCRSSPYMSDDCLSRNSESNSEEWELEEIPQNRDNELYDALGRISLSESVSSSHELEGMVQQGTHVNGGLQSSYAENGVKTSQSRRFLDLPSFENLNLNPLYEQETKSEFEKKDLQGSHFIKEPTPLPPPLPPLEWRVMKPHLDGEDDQDGVPQAPNHAFDVKPLGSIISLQPKPSPVKQHQNNEEAFAFPAKNQQPENKKLNEQKEAKQATNGNGMDDKDDFLNQIRAKSFSLRRTSIARSMSTPNPPANFKVTAILEKANAIRQAVGSDDEEDDDAWSDT